ncbi:MAG: CAP domain-containing protein [Bacteroidetes bacterium]|nr:CAP domain-containing protein [Bacteroidota bacterium]
MKSLLFLLSIPLLMTAVKTNAQASVWESWDTEVVRSLHTGNSIPYLTEEEQKVILFMNMARHDGPLFAETFVKTYVEENQVEKSSYLRSLYKDLAKVSGLSPLYPEEDLTSVAQGHALKSGETGHVGHRNMKKRFAPLERNPYYAWGENCSYGYGEAVGIVIILLIDEGIEGVGHRKNILNESFNSVGVAIRPHTSYRVNCVMDFGKKNRSDLNRIPF